MRVLDPFDLDPSHWKRCPDCGHKLRSTHTLTDGGVRSRRRRCTNCSYTDTIVLRITAIRPEFGEGHKAEMNRQKGEGR